MKPLILPLLALALTAFVACAEDDHEHDAEDFASYDECVEHYTAEGHDDAEIEERCAELEDNSSSSG